MFGSSTPVQCAPTETHVPGGELVERTMVSAKFDDASLEFLDMWSRLQKPYAVSQSSLVNLAVSIVRKLVTNGTISLEPGRLQEFLSTESTNGTRSTKVIPK